MSKVYVNDGYMMLLDAIYFNGKKIGNVSDDGIDWGGDAAEYIKLFAAQVRNAPVKKIKKKGYWEEANLWRRKRKYCT